MYKRQIDDIENIKSIEIYGSGKNGAYFSMDSFLATSKPFNGLYIKNNKVIVSNIYENIIVRGKKYSIKSLNTISDSFENKEYICTIDLDLMQYMYRCENVTYKKTISFIDKTDILCIEYDIENESDDKIKFEICPLLTYRELLYMKKSNILKFGKRLIDLGTLINLNITDNINLEIICDDAKYVNSEEYVNNVKHEYTNFELKKDTFIEDLYIPGKFEIDMKPKTKKSVKVYISTEHINYAKYKDYKNVIKDDIEDVDNEYVELISLKKALTFFENTKNLSMPQIIDVENTKSNLNDKNFDMYINELVFVIKSIDGRYISLNNCAEAKKCIEKLIENIKSLDEDLKNLPKCILAMLWLCEIINKLYIKDETYISKKMKDFLCECLGISENIINTDRYEIKKNLELVCLIYNCLKIYESIFKDPSYESLSYDIEEYILKNFWIEEKRVLKKEIDDLEACATIEMLYAISMSFCPLKKDIQSKVLDTVFRELYTPYGMRTCSKSSIKASSKIYPKYMAYFIYANLNQNEKSYAAKKIAYNLVKDLFLDISKYVQNTVKYVYSDKGIDIDCKVLDLFTTSEIIRLYTMFM